MEKFGVETRRPTQDVDKEEVPGGHEKTAVLACPWCHLPVKRHGSVTLCPTHGSAPWEGDADDGGDDK